MQLKSKNKSSVLLVIKNEMPARTIASIIAQLANIFFREKLSTIQPVAKKNMKTGKICISPISARCRGLAVAW
jgi:hypothetical protein